jgi:hypothetical protein
MFGLIKLIFLNLFLQQQNTSDEFRQVASISDGVYLIMVCISDGNSSHCLLQGELIKMLKTNFYIYKFYFISSSKSSPLKPLGQMN